MVVISIKQSDGDGFLFETTTDTSNESLIASLVEVHNQRLRARVVVDACRDLATHGCMLEDPSPSHGDTESGRVEILDDNNNNNNNDDNNDANDHGNRVPDPTGRRDGHAPDASAAEAIRRTTQDLHDYVNVAVPTATATATAPTQAPRTALRADVLDEKLAHVRGAVVMAFPMGLPSWDTAKVALDGTDQEVAATLGSGTGATWLHPSTTSLWMAGREFKRDQFVRDRLGRNEKQKVIARLQESSRGPPCREPIVSEEERNAMMAFYYKRQEELKKLGEADNDNDYLNSPWADPKGMKRNLQGIGSVRAPGMRF